MGEWFKQIFLEDYMSGAPVKWRAKDVLKKKKKKRHETVLKSFSALFILIS